MIAAISSRLGVGTDWRNYLKKMIPIKRTKSIEIYYDEQLKGVVVRNPRDPISLFVPLVAVPQVIRGLFSAMQRFWRKKLKKS